MVPIPTPGRICFLPNKMGRKVFFGLFYEVPSAVNSQWAHLLKKVKRRLEGTTSCGDFYLIKINTFVLFSFCFPFYVALTGLKLPM